MKFRFTILLCLLGLTIAMGVMAQGRVQAPSFQIDPFWPKPLPNHWILGSVTGLTVDSRDHVWITHVGASSMARTTEMGTGTTPPTAERCCSAAPPILEFDAEGNLVSSWGGPGEGYQFPRCVWGVNVDPKGNVWIGGTSAQTQNAAPRACQFGTTGGSSQARGAQPGGRGVAPVGGDAAEDQPAAAATAARGTAARGAAVAAALARGAANRGAAAGGANVADAQVIRFAPGGKFLLQIGTAGKIEGPESTTTLNRPANMDFDPAANEIYVADTGNNRIAVFDLETGAFKRSWGAYGSKPTTADLGPYDPNAAPAQQFRWVNCVVLAKDGLVYVCDRVNDRIQVFQKDGKFVKEAPVSKTTLGGDNGGSVWDIAFSQDPQQRYMYVANGYDKKIHVLQRETLTLLTTFGSGGRMAGQFVGVGSLGVDSKGNLYTGENFEGKRVQKWVYKGLANTPAAR